MVRKNTRCQHVWVFAFDVNRHYQIWIFFIFTGGCIEQSFNFPWQWLWDVFYSSTYAGTRLWSELPGYSNDSSAPLWWRLVSSISLSATHPSLSLIHSFHWEDPFSPLNTSELLNWSLHTDRNTHTRVHTFTWEAVFLWIM